MATPDDELIGALAAARLAGVDPSAVLRAAASGHLPVAERTPRGHRLYRRADVDAWRRARVARLREALSRAGEL